MLMKSDSDKRQLSCPLYNFIVKEGYIYCFSWKFNFCFVFDVVSGKIVEKQVMEEYPANAYMLFRLADAGDSIIAFPYIADYILKWDIHSTECTKVDLPASLSNNVGNRKFSAFALKGKEMFLFPADTDQICRFDCVTNEIREVFDIRKYLSEKNQLQDSFLFANGSYLFNDTVYLGCWGTNNIVSFDTHRNMVKLISAEGIGSGIRSICGNKNSIFVLSGDGELLIRNIEDNKEMVVKICGEGEEHWWNTGEERMFYYAGYVFAFAQKTELSKRIRILDGQVEDVFEEQSVSQMKHGDADTELLFGAFNQDQGIVYIYSTQGNIYWFDVVSREKTGDSCLEYDADELARWIKENAKSDNYMREDEYLYGLSDLMNRLLKAEKKMKHSLPWADAGKSIYLHTIKE